MATGKRVVSVSVKRSKRDRAQKLKTIPTDAPQLAVTPRRPYSESLPGYDEADRDYVNNNMEAAVALLDRANDRTVTDGIGVIRLDPELLRMLREHVAVVRKVYADIWDNPSWDEVDDLEAVHVAGVDGLEFAHAIGFVAGAAAMMDLTPRMLIENLGL
jgi:hypothetical protein